jgi:hypothetical protein
MKRLTVLLFSVATFSSLAGSEFCRSLVDTDQRRETAGYSAEIAALDISEGHTIKNPLRFAQDNLGAEVIAAVKDSKAKVLVYLGDGRESFWRAHADGWTIGERVEKPEGFHQVYRAERNGERAYLVLRVNGDDRRVHIESLFRIAGLSSDRLSVIGETRRWKRNYLEAFRSTGKRPDLVVYGMALQTVGSILTRNPVENLPELARVWLTRNRRDLAPNLSKTMDLEGVQMHQLELRNGRTVWVFNNLYGDLSADLLDALIEYRVPRIAYGGTAGALTSKFSVGDVVVPDRWLPSQTEAARPLVWKHVKTLGGKPATYERVPAPAIETLPWLRARSAAGVDLVEVELGYWIERLQKHPEIDFTPFLIVSDVMSGVNHKDLTEWGKHSSELARKAIFASFDHHFRFDRDSDFRIRDYRRIDLKGAGE